MKYINTYYFSKIVFKILKILKWPQARAGLIKRYPRFFFHPHMERDEFLLFEEISRYKKTFLEYGSGGSTIYLLKSNKIVYSVESNPEYFRFMHSIHFIKKAHPSILHYKFVDIGPTNQWGKPLNDTNSDKWPNYYRQIWMDIDPVIEQVDVVFIDGRFRVCCCLYSILKVMEYNWRNTVFLIHDFWRREKYHVVLDFLREIKSTDNLAAFTIKPGINVQDVRNRIEEYALVIA